jgi:hypothetical protein
LATLGLALELELTGARQVGIHLVEFVHEAISRPEDSNIQAF